LHRQRVRHITNFLKAAKKACPASEAARQAFEKLWKFKATDSIPRVRYFGPDSLSLYHKLCVKNFRVLCMKLPESTRRYFIGSQNLRPGQAYGPHKPAMRKRSLSADIIVGMALAGRVSYVRGICEICKKILLAPNKGVRVHLLCEPRNDGQLKFRLSLPDRDKKPGRRPENLTLSFRWALLNVIGNWSYGAIAEHFAVSDELVRKRIKRLIAQLPEEKFVGVRYKSIVRILCGESTLTQDFRLPPRKRSNRRLSLEQTRRVVAIMNQSKAGRSPVF
jgi:hypothetical protein